MPNEADLVARAQTGDRAALNELVEAMKDMVYNLAARMLGNPADAEDSTQEILIRLVTGLRDFRAESSFRTWVYRVASNHLLTSKKKQAEEKVESFETLEAILEPGIASPLPGLDDALLVNEAKLRCTSAMLLALDRDHRLAFILGEVLELPSEEAASVLGIEDGALRKRLSRARTRMADFMGKTCGLVDDSKPCRCARQAACGVKAGYMNPAQLTWATLPVQKPREVPVRDLVELTRAAEVFRGLPQYASSAAVTEGLRKLIAESDSTLFA